MAHNDRRPGESTDESADTASFKRFVDQEDSSPTDNRSFRLLTLVVAAVVFVIAVVLLLLLWLT